MALDSVRTKESSITAQGTVVQGLRARDLGVLCSPAN
jgi:hypothetical protein